MQTTLEETDKHTVKLTVEVETERFGKDLDRAYRKIAQQVRVPGFRRGKAPRPVIDAQVGRATVLSEFLEDSLPQYYREALREHDLAPIADPDIGVEQAEEGKPFVFTATVEVRPRLRFEERDYKGIRVERPPVDVSDRDVEDLLDRLRERFAELEPVGRPARRGDYVVMDIRATVHDEEVPEGTRPDYLYEVGSGEFVPKLDEELEGKRPGDILRFNETLPEGAGRWGGSEVSFRVLLKEVKGKKLPPADDDFARTASEFDTLDELRRSLREQLRQNRERAADAEVRDRVLRRLTDAVDVELPDRLVDEEAERRVQNAKERAERSGLTLEQVLEAQGLDELSFRADARAHAVRAIKSDLALEAVARAEHLEVSAEEIEREIAALARAVGREPREVERTLERSGEVVSVAGDILRTKALDVVVSHAEIVDEGRRPVAEPVAGRTGKPAGTREEGRAEDGA
jgi:trigger factor